MKDKNGREYAKLSQIKAGDRIEVAGGFGCLGTGVHLVEADTDGTLFVRCIKGTHYLDAQLAYEPYDNSLIGFYPVEPPTDPLVTKSDPIE